MPFSRESKLRVIFTLISFLVVLGTLGGCAVLGYIMATSPAFNPPQVDVPFL